MQKNLGRVVCGELGVLAVFLWFYRSFWAAAIGIGVVDPKHIFLRYFIMAAVCTVNFAMLRGRALISTSLVYLSGVGMLVALLFLTPLSIKASVTVAIICAVANCIYQGYRLGRDWKLDRAEVTFTFIASLCLYVVGLVCITLWALKIMLHIH